MAKPMLTINVGNIGNVLETVSRKEASDIFRYYCEMSENGTGRASMEDVTVFCEGEPVMEHQGLLSRLASIDAGFMQSDIQKGEFWEIETKNGSCIIPGDLVSLETSYTSFSEHLELFLDYIPESCGFAKIGDILSAERKTGYGARLSSPGYLDSTEWSLFETEIEAIRYIVETYGNEFENDNDDDEEVEETEEKA